MTEATGLPHPPAVGETRIREQMDAAQSEWDRAVAALSDSPASAARPAVTEAMVEAAWRALVLDDPTNISITKDDLRRSLEAALQSAAPAQPEEPRP